MSITSRAPRKVNWASNATDPTVGPGSYETTEGIIAAADSPFPFLTTAARFKDNPNGNPGPADYHPEIPRLDIRGGGCMMRSGSPRKGFDTIDSPAPCTYQRLQSWDKDAAGRRGNMSSRSPRPFLDIKTTYTATCADFDLRPGYDRGAQIAKSGRGALYRIDNNPGPGAYNVAPPKTRNPRSKGLPSHEFLSSAERHVFCDRPLVDYDGRSQEQWAKPKGFAPFGVKAKRKAIWNTNKVPGPGQYDVESPRKFRRSSAPFGVRGPRDWEKPNDNPGPGAYKTGGKRKFKDDSARPFGQRAPRFTNFYSDNPNGPGQYDVDTSEQLKRMRAAESESPAFKYSDDRNPFKGDPTVPGPGMYSPEIGEAMGQTHKLRRCIDGTERIKPGTFIGHRINDAPGPGAYDYEKIKPRISGGYVPHTKRTEWCRNTCAPSPEKYHTEGSLMKPSLNVTYSMCKL